MTENARPIAVDYLKFIFACDSEMFQNDYQSTWEKLRAGAAEFGAKEAHCKITVLGGKNIQGSRYVVELVGPVAEYLKLIVPANWYTQLRRIDWRTEMKELTSKLISSAQAWAMLQEKGKRNISAFNSPSRIKTTSRDIGGRGLFLGSRKSDVHAAVYRRGSELGAYEFRLQNKLCRDLVAEVAFGTSGNSLPEDLYRLYNFTANAEANLLSETIGVERPSFIPGRMAAIAEHMPELAEVPPYSQMAVEARHYEQKSVEEQADDQNCRWTPTEKGWAT